MPKIHMPDVSELGAQLGALVGKTATIRECDAANIFDESCHTARYATRDDDLAALCQVELPIAAALGAALAMIPLGVAEEAIKVGELGENLTDAYSEVANIMAGLLCADGTPHVRWIGSVEKTLGALTDDDKQIIQSPCGRVDVEIEIEGYCGGKMSIVTASLD